MKKTSKKTKNNKKRKPAEELKTVSPVPPGFVSFQLNDDELSAIIQLLQWTKISFKNLADHATSQGDIDTVKVYSARSQLSELLLNKFKGLAYIGEPDSRSVH